MRHASRGVLTCRFDSALAPVNAASFASLVQSLPGLAGGFAPLGAALGAVRFDAGLLTPKAEDEYCRDGQLVDHADAFFLRVDPVEIFRIVISVRKRLHGQHPVARRLARVDRLP